MHTIECKFMMKDSVTIKALNRAGVVQSMLFFSSGVEYKVRYFNDYNDPCETFFYEEELAPAEKTSLKQV